MASTNPGSTCTEVEPHERHRSSSASRSNDSRRLDDQRRDRSLGRADRAPRRRDRRQRVPSRRAGVADLHRLVRGHRADVPGRAPRSTCRSSGASGARRSRSGSSASSRRSPSSGSLAYFGLGWNHRQAEIGGLALSTTSLAVVYAVLVETGLNRELVGKRLMSATFVTDIATVAGLTVLFVKPTIWIVPVRRGVGRGDRRPAAGSRRGSSARYGNRVIEPEIKLVFAVALPADVARRPRELAGRAAGVRARARDEQPLRIAPQGAGAHARRRLRVPDAVLLLEGRHERLGRRTVGEPRDPRRCSSPGRWCRSSARVYPLARRYTAPHATFTTLLMSTGLTFGTITSLYGLNAGIIDRTQFSLLISVVVLSAIVPTAIAQRFFHPHAEPSGSTPWRRCPSPKGRWADAVRTDPRCDRRQRLLESRLREGARARCSSRTRG